MLAVYPTKSFEEAFLLPQSHELVRLIRTMNDRAEQSLAATPAEKSDRDIVARVVGGNREAYALLVQRYAPIVRNYLAGRGLRAFILDECAQDVFVSVYQQLANLKDGNRFFGYLMTTARRKLADVARSQSKLDSTCDVESLVKASADSNHVPSEELQAAIAVLPDPMQVVLGLKYGKGKTAAEIGELLGRSTGSITKLLSQAYERLRRNESLRRSWVGEEDR